MHAMDFLLVQPSLSSLRAVPLALKVMRVSKVLIVLAQVFADPSYGIRQRV